MITKAGNSYSISACAKINLFLRITGKQPSGYHELYSLFVPISIYDVLTINRADATILTCNESDIPTDDRNIVLKTDSILRAEYGLKDCYNIHLDKTIPSGAGLGGGSSNAAAYMRLVDEVSNLGLSKQDMVDIMSRVGSDTIFFIDSVPSVVTGRGEVVEAYGGLSELYLLIVNPNIHISTKDVFNSSKLAFSDKNNIPKLKEVLTFDDMSYYIYNDMENAAFELAPEVAKIKGLLNGYAGGVAAMSGSGSSVFAVYASKQDRDSAYQYFKDTLSAYKVYCAEIA